MGLSITTGAFPVVAVILGLAALIALVYGRSAVWWRRRLPIAVAVGLVVTAGLTVFTNEIWHPFPDPVPTTAVIWIGLTLIGFGLAVLRPSKWPVRVGCVGLALMVGIAGAAQVNAGFGAYPTPGAVFGEPLPHQVELVDVLHHPSTSQVTVPVTPVVPTSASATPLATVSTAGTTPPVDGPLIGSWAPVTAVPAAGEVTTAPIPGTVSGFTAADAWIYLPPAFQMSPRPDLPVLILLTGQPGTPRQWFDGGTVAQTMDAYAAAHHGLAPVVVVPDWIGTQSSNPLCVDSAAGGNDFTYLSVDVPAWIKTNLGIDTRPSRWAVGGLSSGGTCAVQLAVNAPTVFPTFLCFSGQEEPTLSTRPDTVNALFGGDESAFKRINPIDVLQSRPFPELAGMFIAGAGDPDYGPQTKTVYTVAQQAGVDATYMELPGGHDFPLWSSALAASLDWLGTHLSITT